MLTAFRHALRLSAVVLVVASGCGPTPGEHVTETANRQEVPGERAQVATTTVGEGRVYYQFVDEGGGVRFVERLEDVPERWRASAGKVEMSTPPPLTPADARAANSRNIETTGSPRAAAPRVILYYAKWCGYCRKAKAHLDRREIPYELKDVDVRAVKQEMLAKTGRSGIPVVDIDGRILQGYQAESLDAMLDTAGL